VSDQVHAGTSAARLTVGEHAPLFVLPDTDGTPIGMEPAAHEATVVVFTSNGCPFALAWHDRLQAVARDHADRDVVVLQVVSNDETDHPEDSPEGMRRRVAAGELAGPFLRDAEQAVAQAYGATATPEVFVVDRAGLVRYHGAPDADHDDPAQDAGWLREALGDVLAGRDVARPVTSPAGCSVKWRVELLWWAGCPSHGRAADLLRGTLADLGRGEVHVVEREVRSREEAARLGFPGSPTFQVGRRDLFPVAAPAALTCRVYPREDGRGSPLPERTELAGRLREALARPWDLPHWVDPRRPAPADSPS
jgi:peroxiredoxin